MASVDVSVAAATDLVPDVFFNFTANLLCDKVCVPVKGSRSNRVYVDQETEEKALLVSQQLLFQIAGVTTPLAVGTACHLYNQTRSKSLITLNNKLGQGISYETMQRQLTSKCTDIVQQIEEAGVYIPPNISQQCSVPPVFAFDNLDWKTKSLEGGSFHATTAIVIQPGNDAANNQTAAGNVTESISIRSGTCRRDRKVKLQKETELPRCHVTVRERRESRSLSAIPSVQSLVFEDGAAEDLLMI